MQATREAKGGISQLCLSDSRVDDTHSTYELCSRGSENELRNRQFICR